MALRKFSHYDFRKNLPVGSISGTQGVPVVTTDASNYFQCGGLPLVVHNDGQNDDIGFTPHLNGWVIPNDNTDDDGIEIVPSILSNALLPHCFTVGTDGAFFARAVFQIPDVSDYDVAFAGFRVAGAFAADGAMDDPAEIITAYNSICGLNVNAGAIWTNTRLAAAAGTQTDSTNTVADTNFVALETRVSAAGVVSFLKGVSTTAELALAALAAPTVNTNTITHAAAVILVPELAFMKGANAADTPPILTQWTWGLL